MQEKPLEQTERALLAIIIDNHDRDGHVERNALNVEARGRGIEVGRALVMLKKAGLVEEYEYRPGFMARLFGRQAKTLLRPLSALPAYDPEPAPVVKSTVVTPLAPPPQVIPPVPVRPVTFAADDYTDKVGGGEAIGISNDVDPETVEGLREMLETMGLDLTMAGEALISDRLGRGESAGNALSQVVLYTFAHAVHYDLLDGGGMQVLGLTEYAIEVMQELEKLRDAQAIDADRFEADMRTIWSIVSDENERDARADQVSDLLRDPIGGAAPPALLPDDIQQADDPDAE